MICVFQAAYVHDMETRGEPRKAIIEALTASFDKSDHINYQPSQFDAAFKVRRGRRVSGGWVRGGRGGEAS